MGKGVSLLDLWLDMDRRNKERDMKPFEINPECDACGQHNAELKFFSNGEGWLEVTCNICGHNWDMETKDIKKENKKEEKYSTERVIEELMRTELEYSKQKVKEVDDESSSGNFSYFSSGYWNGRADVVSMMMKCIKALLEE